MVHFLDETAGLDIKHLSTTKDPLGGNAIVAISINGKEYNFSAPEQVIDSYLKQRKYSEGRALAFLKKNSKDKTPTKAGQLLSTISK